MSTAKELKEAMELADYHEAQGRKRYEQAAEDEAANAAHDWLFEQADFKVSGHMLHLLHLHDGDGARCGCTYQGQGLPS